MVVVQPPMTTSCPARHFDFAQRFGAARYVGCIELLGDDAFERQPAGRLQHRIAAILEMLDIAEKMTVAPFHRLEQLRQPLLALGERHRAQIVAVLEQQIEGKEDQIVRLLFGQGQPAARRNPARHFRRARRSRRR